MSGCHDATHYIRALCWYQHRALCTNAPFCVPDEALHYRTAEQPSNHFVDQALGECADEVMCAAPLWHCPELHLQEPIRRTVTAACLRFTFDSCNATRARNRGLGYVAVHKHPHGGCPSQQYIYGIVQSLLYLLDMRDNFWLVPLPSDTLDNLRLRFIMGLSHQGSRNPMPQQKRCNIGVSP